MIGGLWGLSVLSLPHIVLSILGLAGSTGGGLRLPRYHAEELHRVAVWACARPFRIGDYIHVAGQAGSGQTTRAGARDPGGNVGSPTAIIYKEI